MSVTTMLTKMTVTRMFTQSNRILSSFNMYNLDAAFSCKFSPRHVEAEQLLQRREYFADVDDQHVEESIEDRVQGQRHVLPFHQDRVDRDQQVEDGQEQPPHHQ